METEQERVIKTTVKVPKSLYDQYKHMEIDREEKVADLILLAMRTYLKVPQTQTQTVKPKPTNKNRNAKGQYASTTTPR